MGFLKRMFGRGSEGSATAASDAVILSAPIGKKIWDLDRNSLKALITDMKASEKEDPSDTIMRYLGGDVVSDLEEKFGAPERRQMARTKDGQIVITLVLPKVLWKRTDVATVYRQAQERLIFRYEEYVGTLLDRAKQLGDANAIRTLEG